MLVALPVVFTHTVYPHMLTLFCRGQTSPVKNSVASEAPSDSNSSGSKPQHAAAAVTSVDSKPKAPERRCVSAPRRVLAGDSWGTYNPLTHTWSQPPKDPRFEDTEGAMAKYTTSGIHTKKASRPASQGSYDPIRAVWKEAPKDTRSAAGAAFAPAELFKDGPGGSRPTTPGSTLRQSNVTRPW